MDEKIYQIAKQIVHLHQKAYEVYLPLVEDGCRSDEGRREALNKEFERCCTFLAEMMEKYGLEVLRDIAADLQHDPETLCYGAEGKRFRCETYMKRFMERFNKAA